MDTSEIKNILSKEAVCEICQSRENDNAIKKMNELKQFIIVQLDEYKKKYRELLLNEESIIETSEENMEYLTLYEGIIEGLLIVSSYIKQQENK